MSPTSTAPDPTIPFPLPSLAPEDAARLREILGRDPSATEIRVIDVAWSEHCSYRSSRHLLKTLPTEAPHVVLGPGEDAGIVSLGTGGEVGGERLCAVLAHESHNHPSQLLPVEGAATGIGGIVRDVYCMGADTIGVLDALRFGDPRGAAAADTRAIVRGVGRGIALYGDALGVPNLGGDVAFDGAYDTNCLVNVVALGVVRENQIVRSRVPAAAAMHEYVLVLVGKATDATGLGGASFASAVLDGTFESAGAVQVPDPFLKRVLTEAMKVAFGELWFAEVEFGCKDLGAGGLATAAAELAAKGGFGCTLDLDTVPRALPDLPPDVVACAETQERYILALPAESAERFCEVFNRDFELARLSPNAGAYIVGTPRTDGRVVFVSDGVPVCDIPVDALAEAPATPHTRAPRPAPAAPATPARALRVADWGATWRALLAHPSVMSKRQVYEAFDGDVQGRTAMRRGAADAGVVLADPGARIGLAMSVDCPTGVCALDAYAGGVLAVAEAMRNVACVGAIPWALTDCLNFGSPRDPHVADDLACAVAGLGDAARGLGLYGAPEHPVPFVSGNVSLYNQSHDGVAIPPTPMVACLGLVPDVTHTVGAAADACGGGLVYLGAPGDALGGSTFDALAGATRTDVPHLDFAAERRLIHGLVDLIRTGHVAAAHDVSAGGLLACVAEMLMPLQAGCDLDVGDLVDRHGEAVALCAETGGIVVQARVGEDEALLRGAAQLGVPATPLGRVTVDGSVVLRAGAEVRCTLDIATLSAAWDGGWEEAGL